MALRKEYELPSLAIADYWKITDFQVDLKQPRIVLEISAYLNERAKLSGGKSMHVETIFIEEPGVIDELFKSPVGDKKTAYDILASLSYQFLKTTARFIDAEDV